MCGIVYAKSFAGQDVTEIVLKRFEAQRARGVTSFGFYLPDKDKLVHNVKEARIKALLKRTKGDNQEVLFHHRYSTSTPDVRNACHPFSTKDTFDYEYIGVHNGVVNNAYMLKRDHEELGIGYVSLQEPEGTGTYRKFNDSEALIYDLARYFEGKVDKVTAYGTIAFIVVRVDSTGKARKLFFGTNRESLVMKRTKNSLIVSSEGSGDPVPNNTLHMYDYDTHELTTQPMEIPKSYPYAGSSYQHKPYSTSSSNTSRDSASPYRDMDDEDFGRQWADSYNEEKYRQGYLRDSVGGVYSEDSDLTKEERDDLIEALAHMEDNDDVDEVEELYGFEGTEFVVMMGTKRDLKKRILEKNKKDHSKAIAECREKLAEAITEMNRLNELEVDVKDHDEFLEYYGVLVEYSETLSNINEELKREAQAIQDTKERRTNRVFGFHGTSTSITPASHNLTH